MVKKDDSKEPQAKITISAAQVRQWARDAYYVIWSLVGLVILIAVVVAVATNTSLVDMVVGGGAPAGEQVPAAEQQTGLTEEQLKCVQEEVGEERMIELEQGAPVSNEEAELVQGCLSE